MSTKKSDELTQKLKPILLYKVLNKLPKDVAIKKNILTILSELDSKHNLHTITDKQEYTKKLEQLLKKHYLKKLEQLDKLFLGAILSKAGLMKKKQHIYRG